LQAPTASHSLFRYQRGSEAGALNWAWTENSIIKGEEMTKKELAQRIAEDMRLPQLKVLAIVQKTFDDIINTLLREGRIELRNFGVFEVRHRRAREARNPRTGESVPVPPRNVVAFKAGRAMEERVREMKLAPKHG
jgi:nucleoid DNA-binding protein